VDWDALRGVCGPEGVVLIEDSAQGLGSSIRGQVSGALGDMTVLSFGRGKGWTGGGGGALLIRDSARGTEAWALQSIPNSGFFSASRAGTITLVQWAFGRPWIYGLPAAVPWLGLGETAYKEPSEVKGISAFSAGLAAATEGPSLAEIAVRQRTAKTLTTRLSSVLHPEAGQFPHPIPGGGSSFLRLPLLISEGADSFMARKDVKRLGVARGYHEALSRLPQLSAGSVPIPGGMPGAELLARNLVTLPTHSLVSCADLDRIVRLFS